MTYVSTALVLFEAVVFVVYGARAYGRRLLNLLIAIDRLGNAYLGGDPCETISSRASKNLDKRGWRALAKFLDWIDPDHVEKSREDHVGDRAAWK